MTEIGLREFVERYPFVDGPLSPPVAAFVQRMSWPTAEQLMIPTSTPGEREPRLPPTHFLLRNEETGELETHDSPTPLLSCSLAAGRTVLAVWSRFGATGARGSDGPYIVVVDEM